MFVEAKGRDSVIECLLSEVHADTVDEIGEEFLWDVAASVGDLERIGSETRVKLLSICLEKSPFESRDHRLGDR